ncbi:MAG: DUF5054 domain-containing protein [Chloroflexi bacterium]|uniref:DUF5054 domain-containing protein n=1 Tax=Candidatus Flexifilum breve TaxID=3140694 RepID=UPI0031354CF6|nr:DUF5054 domain-containing protein [Chloroflexota bacterium]
MQTSDHGASVEKIHLVFKTHLDLGFTNLARVVFRHYMDDFIPAALRLAQLTRERGTSDRFVWTTGSWLIYHYLEQAASADRRLMEDAIAAGDIAWHALPFTTHTELLDADLFRFGLSIAQTLDRRFGRTTIAAKMTDVPGHTRGIVPLMAEAGIKLMHIGVNEASTMPHVPPVFRWRDAASGHELIMIYEHHYGGLVQVPGLRAALVLQMTGDNIGPPNLAALDAVYHELRARFPQAQITPTTLDTFASALESVRDQLPVITEEIGDSWIHGVGTDPQKVKAWRELVRLRRTIVQAGTADLTSAAWFAFQDALLCAAEHTWGMDTKLHLPNYTAYTADELAAVRATPMFQTMASSWTEQRAYLDQAVSALEGTRWHERARASLAPDAAPALPKLTPPAPLHIETPHLLVDFDAQSGAISGLVTRADGRIWAAPDHRLALFRYQTFDAADYDRFWDEYIQSKDRETVTAWARYDYGKPGIAGKALSIVPTPAQVIGLSSTRTDEGTTVIMQLKLPDAWSSLYGAPPLILVSYHIHENHPLIDVRLTWADKPACRLPEALWLSFQPLAPAARWRFEKLNQWVDPTGVVSGGSRGLHAVFDRVTCAAETMQLQITTRDAPLVAPGAPALLRFPNVPPDMSGGVHINLFNNAWGTNFPQWNEGNAAFGFQLEWMPLSDIP